MDRIREAITRARDAGAKALAASQPARATPAAPVAYFTRQHADDDDRFTPVSCKFERFAENRIISNEQDPVLNAYRVLRTRILQKMEKENWRTIAVVSACAGAGKTVTAINLAIAIGSRKGSRATLVDLDFYRPRIAEYLGLDETPSVLDYFEGSKSLEEVTVRPDLPDVLVLANERVSRRGAEHLTSARADAMVAKAVDDYHSRVVIFDMSPLLGCDDAIAFLPKVDCVLLVTASNQTRIKELKDAKRVLANHNLIGTVLNKAPVA
ncbi:MAG: CpsD/CapB family tyrosine-protein kinase, partial [Parvularculaceae bacterium]